MKRGVLTFLLAISGCFAAEPLVGRLGASGVEALLDYEWQLGQSRVTGERSDSELRSLFAARDWFQLRDAVERSADAPAFYRGAVACAFNDVDSAERHFRGVIKAPGEVQQAAEAHGLLAHAYIRSGRYRQTYAHLAAM
jgi:hypothetical protein